MRHEFAVLEILRDAATLRVELAQLQEDLSTNVHAKTAALRRSYDAAAALRESIEGIWRSDLEDLYGPGGIPDHEVVRILTEALTEELSGMHHQTRTKDRIVSAIAQGRVRLLASGGVLVAGEVESDSGNTYRATSDPSGHSCECSAGRHRHRCWHIDAIELKEAAVNLGLLPDREQENA